MSRYVRDLPVSMSPEQATAAVNAYMQSQGFTYGAEKGEAVWRKGGFFAIPQFLKAEPGSGVVHIEAWVATFSLMPGVYFGENDLEGAFGFAIKAQLKRRVGELETALSTTAPAAAMQPEQGTTPA